MNPEDLLASLPRLRTYRSRRVSSYDRSGGNHDWVVLDPGQSVTLADIKGAGIVKHIWCTTHCKDVNYPRTLVLRVFWDNEKTPSIEAPLGDFFGVGHAKVSPFQSLPLNQVTGGSTQESNRAAMNCFFPMPFRKAARFELVNESSEAVQSFYYYIDYEEHDKLADDTAYLHAQYRQEKPTKGYETWHMNAHSTFVDQKNTTGAENYVVFEAEGRGHYVGTVLSIRNVMFNDIVHSWFGEGDDMIFVDGEKWPPALHGTGTEDYVCAAWGFPSGKYDGLFHGISLAGNTTDWGGEWTAYRFHLESPVTFTKSIRVTIEHGHDNNRFDDWSSVGFWYQVEPHGTFPELPKVEERLPRR
ncbi:MAG: glycoside hydrolase family 172 protein [Candidatus Sumerlaeaceae bacterium]